MDAGTNRCLLARPGRSRPHQPRSVPGLRPPYRRSLRQAQRWAPGWLCPRIASIRRLAERWRTAPYPIASGRSRDSRHYPMVGAGHGPAAGGPSLGGAWRGRRQPSDQGQGPPRRGARLSRSASGAGRPRRTAGDAGSGRSHRRHHDTARHLPSRAGRDRARTRPTPTHDPLPRLQFMV